MTALALVLGVTDEHGNGIDVSAGGLFIGLILLIVCLLIGWFVTAHPEGPGLPRWVWWIAVGVGLVIFFVLGFDIAITDG